MLEKTESFSHAYLEFQKLFMIMFRSRLCYPWTKEEPSHIRWRTREVALSVARNGTQKFKKETRCFIGKIFIETLYSNFSILVLLKEAY